MEKKDFVYYDNTYGVLKKLKHDVVLTERIVETILQIFFLFYYAYLIYNNVNINKNWFVIKKYKPVLFY